MLLRATVCIWAGIGAALAQTPATQTYSFLLSGNMAGKCTATAMPDGTTEVQYSFNDRGRGPDIRGRYRFDARGLPISVELSGKDYYKAPVDEHLTVTDAEARWKSTIESGQAAASGFYISNAGPPIELGWLVNALLKSPDQALKLLPGGQARLENGAHTTVSQDGRTVAVKQYLVTGLDFTPSSVGWMPAIACSASSVPGVPSFGRAGRVRPIL